MFELIEEVSRSLKHKSTKKEVRLFFLIFFSNPNFLMQLIFMWGSSLEIFGW